MISVRILYPKLHHYPDDGEYTVLPDSGGLAFPLDPNVKTWLDNNVHTWRYRAWAFPPHSDIAAVQVEIDFSCEEDAMLFRLKYGIIDV